MARKKHSAEQIVALLRQIEVELANHKSIGQVSLVTILSGCEINNFAEQSQSRSAITWLPCLTCFGSGSEPCFAGFGRLPNYPRKSIPLSA
jgi:hypothetical protein